MADLSDEEFFWEPCAACWNVRVDPARPHRWVMDYPDIAPDPPPVTTIAWRLLHVTHGNWIYWEHAFGPGERNFRDLEISASAGAAVADLIASHQPIAETFRRMTDADLDELRPTHMGGPLPAGEVLEILLNEQVHHGAEISLLRDLFRNRATLRA